MQAAIILAALQRAAHAPAMAGIYIKSVAIAATRDWGGAALMTITWSMPDTSSSIPTSSLPGITATTLSRPSDTAVLLPRELASLAEIEDAVLQSAWVLGAWDCVRLEKPPLLNPDDWQASQHGVASDFGVNPYTINEHPLLTGDQCPVSASTAATEGYVLWRFVPLAIATPLMRKRFADKDNTLQPDCARSDEPSGYRAKWCHPSVPGQLNEHQYQLGRENHGNRSKSARERRAGG